MANAEPSSQMPLENSVPAPGSAGNAETTAPNPTPVDVPGYMFDLGTEITELMKKGPQFKNEAYAKILVQLLNRMPVCVTGGGVPDGRLIKGFLFKYDAVEGAKIVCSCHGDFFDAAEFLKHAGGDGDVANPSKFIQFEFFG